EPAAQPAAQPAQATRGEAILVTARRTEERLESVPLAITAFSSESLEAQDIQSLNDISDNSPGFQFQNQAGGGSGRNDRSINNLTFRGLFLANVTPISQGGLVFIDGAPVINSSVPAIDDVARVEVLKGPQAAYFGRSTFSGAVNFVTKAPSYEFGGRIKAMYGNYGSNQVSGSVEFPLIDQVLALRVGGSHVFEGGQYKNSGDPNETFGDRKNDVVSAQMLFEPASNLKITGFFSYGEMHDGPPAQAALKNTEFNCDLGGTSGSYWCGALPNRMPEELIGGNYDLDETAYGILIDNVDGYPTIFDPSFNPRSGLKRQTVQADLRMDWEMGNGMVLSSITAYHTDRTQTALDLTFRDTSGYPNPNFGIIPGAPSFNHWLLNYQTDISDFSQEIRLTSAQTNRLRWTVGASYFTADYDNGAIYGLNVFGSGNSSTLRNQKPKTPAIFGALYFDITQDLTIGAEGRYQWDKIESSILASSSGVYYPEALVSKATFKSFSPRVTLDYAFAPDSTAYILFSRGYRPGGFNDGYGALTPTEQAQIATSAGATYDEERLDNYEAGIKTAFWNGRASLRAAIYIDKYRGGQVANSYTYYPDGSPTINLINVTENIGAVDLWGIELEGDVSPMEGLSLSGSFGLAESEIKSFVCAECLNIAGTNDATGNRLSGVPRLTWTASASYEHPVAEDWWGYARIDYRHRGRQYVDYYNAAWSRNDDKVDLRIGARQDNGLSFEAFATNLFNEQTLTGFRGTDLVTLATNDIRIALPEKRRLGIRFSYEF
ncbi:TonB-dependent receptor, partial [Novosphingobium mangrovi (ex Hu et al. 2023)]